MTAWLARAAIPPLLREFARFLLIGGTSALAYVAINAGLTAGLGLRPSLSILLALVILIPPTYLAQRRLTFASQVSHSRAFPRYVGTQCIGNRLALVVAELFPAAIRSRPMLAYAVLAVVVATMNYGCLKFWAFRRRR